MDKNYTMDSIRAQANALMDESDNPQEWYMGLDKYPALNDFYNEVVETMNCMLMNEGYVLDISTQMGLGTASLWKDDEKLFTVEFNCETTKFFNTTTQVLEDDWDGAVDSVAKMMYNWYLEGIA